MSGQTFESVRIGSTPVEVEHEPLFYLPDPDSGEDIEYTIPKKIPANITIKYLNWCATLNQEIALGRAMRVVLGEDAMEALAEADSVTDEDMERLMGIIERKLQGQIRKSLGKSRNGRPRSGG